MTFKNLLKWLFTKQQGDEDPIVLEDTEHPLTEAEIKALDNNQAAQDILKNISVTPKKETVVKAEVTVAVVKPVDEIKVDVVIPEPPKPAPPPAPKPLPPKNFNDGFTSTGSLYGSRKKR